MDDLSSPGDPDAVTLNHIIGSVESDRMRQQASLAVDPPKPLRSLQGCIDQANRTLIEGWVWDPKNPDERIELEVLKAGQRITATIADRNRPSLMTVGIGDGRHAFSIELPAAMLSQATCSLDLRCAATGAIVPGSPITLDQTTEPLPTALRWHIDEITDSGVIGWAFSPVEPARRCIIALREGSRLHARAAASRYRPGLREAGLGDGACAFLLPLPHTLLDGEEHQLNVIEEHTGTALTKTPLVWRSTAGTASVALTNHQYPQEPETPATPPPIDIIQWRTSAAPALDPAASPPEAALATRILFDISDLVYYIGEHGNLTGIQRVQSSIVLALFGGALPHGAAAIFISFNTKTSRWEAIPTEFLIAFLRDLFLPTFHRIVAFSTEDASRGHLPGAQPLDAPGVLDDGTPSVICLLGAGWNKPDHLHHILAFKRGHGTRFVLLVHDLVSMYARETCDEATAGVFEGFLRRAVRHVDHFLAVSENTSRDLRRYVTSLGRPEPAVTVTRNGSSFDEFLATTTLDRTARDDLPDRFVLFVSTIEGRKNHRFILELWRRMISAGDNPPHLICVGYLGWRAECFVSDLVESNYLNGKIILMQDVSDSYLRLLYEHCLFTVYPSLYEGWGLPVGESLAAGKICVCSERASLPEVAGETGICIPLNDPVLWLDTLRALIADDAGRRRQESLVRKLYRPIAWSAVAAVIAAACSRAATTVWTDLYPCPAIPYATEIPFARLAPVTTESSADGMLTRILDSRRGHFLPDPLLESSFWLGEDARADGLWAEPEPWGTWLCTPTGALSIGLPPNNDHVFYAFLRLRTSAPAAGLPGRILANAEIVWQGSFTEKPQDLMLRIRRRTRDGLSWALKLRCELDCPTGLRHQIGAIDARTPMIGFEFLVIIPENDIKSRVDVLTTLQLNQS
jgi:glycosyltransferase involved in cell wall biosynthesis